MSYAAPAAGGDGWSPKDSNGHLLIIEPTAHETGILTTFGEKDAIRATVHDVDTGEAFHDALIFPGALIGSLKSRLGQKVLARLGQGVPKPGQAPPWQLVDASGDQSAVALAMAYEAKLAQGSYAPVEATPQPVAAPVAATPAAGEADAIAAAKALLAQQGMTA